ncbi:MAG: hypothetical protein LBH20_03630 [Treponema sp.]|jgi:hypothetical protein|nr:hypothetical protein [Treponema sp.]
MILNMNDQMTALEIVRRANAPDPFKIIELMGLTNEMLLDIPMKETNNGVVNVTLQRSVKAAGSHRIYNKGFGTVATQTQVVHDRIAMLGAYSKADADMIDQSGNKQAALMSEATGIIKGMGMTQAETLVYGDPNKPDEFAGLMSRCNKIGRFVIDAGGTGNDLTSIYLIAVGPDLFHLIYPKGASGCGVEREDMGRVHEKDPEDEKREYPVYKNYFTAKYGIAVRAPEALWRICNVPKNISGDDLIDLIIDTRHRMPTGAATYVMYSNIEPIIKLDKAARDKGNVVYTKEDPWGRPITHVRDLRCRRMDVILSTEAQVV